MDIGRIMYSVTELQREPSGREPIWYNYHSYNINLLLFLFTYSIYIRGARVTIVAVRLFSYVYVYLVPTNQAERISEGLQADRRLSYLVHIMSVSRRSSSAYFFLCRLFEPSYVMIIDVHCTYPESFRSPWQLVLLVSLTT